jgi:2'-5' RNA ligase
VANTVPVDELHLTLHIPEDTPEETAEVIRRTLASDDFMEQLRRAVLAALRAFPELNAVSGSLAR